MMAHQVMNKLFIVMLTLLAFNVTANDQSLDCQNALSTMEINQCALEKLKFAQTELDQYFAASLEHNAEDAELIKSIQNAQRNWQAYIVSHCDSVYTQWREGTIRGVMAISCKTKLTKQRTHEIWQNFLTYMDSSKPVLPEPDLE